MPVAAGMESGCVLLGKHQKSEKVYQIVLKVAYPNQSGLEGIALLGVHFYFFLHSKPENREAKRKKRKEERITKMF